MKIISIDIEKQQHFRLCVQFISADAVACRCIVSVCCCLFAIYLLKLNIEAMNKTKTTKSNENVYNCWSTFMN